MKAIDIHILMKERLKLHYGSRPFQGKTGIARRLWLDTMPQSELRPCSLRNVEAVLAHEADRTDVLYKVCSAGISHCLSPNRE